MARGDVRRAWDFVAERRLALLPPGPGKGAQWVCRSNGGTFDRHQILALGDSPLEAVRAAMDEIETREILG